MLKKAATAIAEARYGMGCPVYEEEFLAARAVLEALRDPDDATLHAAFAAMNETPSGTWKRFKAENLMPKELFVAKMVPRWQAMIDHILRGVE